MVQLWLKVLDKKTQQSWQGQLVELPRPLLGCGSSGLPTMTGRAWEQEGKSEELLDCDMTAARTAQ